MVSLEGNVKIISPDSTSIESSQVYWDPDLEWLFTEKNIVFSGNDYKIRANKMDADRSFKLLKTGQLNGNFLFEDNQMKYFKLSEYLYLVIGLVISVDLIFFEESILDNLPLLLFGILSFLMYFFRRYYRIKFNNRNNNK